MPNYVSTPTAPVRLIRVKDKIVLPYNFPGFLTLAQLPLLFLLGTKNNILAALMGRGYEKLNFLHRWAGRGMFLSATIHGSLWIRSHLKLNVSFNQYKERHGLSAYAVLCTILLISLRPVRNRMYQFFFISQYVNPALLQTTYF